MKKITSFIVDHKTGIIICYIILLALSIWGMFNVNVNYDMSSYLPEEFKIKESITKMDEEFGEASTITLVFHNLSDDELKTKTDELKKLNYIDNVSFDKDSEHYYKNGYSKFILTLSTGTYSDNATKVLNEIKNKYANDEIYIGGTIESNSLLMDTLNNKMPIIIFLAVIVILIILFIICDTWMEPIIFLATIGIAVLINKGTNALMPSISFMTESIGALLQLGLSMDYSIMLMHKYNEEKKNIKDNNTAMKNALYKSTSTIASSSLTTIVGLLVLVFMSFKIGADMGIVLGKGIFISLICVFTLLPGLILSLDKWNEKTKKKSLNIKTNKLMNFLIKRKIIILPIIFICILASICFRNDINVSFVKMMDNPSEEVIEKNFGYDNQILLMHDKKIEKENIKNLIDWLKNKDYVLSVQSYQNTIGANYSYKNLAEEMNFDIDQAELIYKLYVDNSNTSPYEEITMYDLVNYVVNNIIDNPTYKDYLTIDEKDLLIKSQKELKDGKNKIESSLNDLNSASKEIANSKKQLANEKNNLDNKQIMLNKNKASLIENKQLIDNSLNEIDTNLTELETQITNINNNPNFSEEEKESMLLEITSTISELEKNKNNLSLSLIQINNGLGDIENGQTQINDGYLEIENGNKQIKDNEYIIKTSKEKIVNSDAYKMLYKKSNPNELAKFMKSDIEEINSILKLKRMEKLDVNNTFLTLEEVMNFIVNNILTNKIYSRSINNDMKEKIEDGKSQISNAKEMLLGKNYNRIIINYNLPNESKETFNMVDEINRKTLELLKDNNYYLVGDAVMGLEMNNNFSKELNFITILSFIAIFIVVMFTFKSFTGSMLLALTIQSAVLITNSIILLQGISVNYIALILVQCILMGATIDYGILFLNNYIGARKKQEKKESIIVSMNNSIKTILTSSLILITACLLVSILMTQKVTSETCLIIAYGTICSIFMIIIIFPILTYIFDKFIIKKFIQR